MKKLFLALTIVIASSSVSYAIINGETSIPTPQCLTPPSCDSLGYTKSASDCPSGGIKCPWDTSKMFCYPKAVVEDPCDKVTAVTVPANATCSSWAVSCPSKCTAWKCNTGYMLVPSSNNCQKQFDQIDPIEPVGKCGAELITLVCDGRTICCPKSTGYKSCADKEAGSQSGQIKCYTLNLGPIEAQ